MTVSLEKNRWITTRCCGRYLKLYVVTPVVRPICCSAGFSLSREVVSATSWLCWLIDSSIFFLFAIFMGPSLRNLSFNWKDAQVYSTVQYHGISCLLEANYEMLALSRQDPWLTVSLIVLLERLVVTESSLQRLLRSWNWTQWGGFS